jgi:phosphoribosylformylglycinamidine synthase
MLGVMKDKSLQTTLDFKYKGDLIYLLGVSRNDLNSSEYLANIVGVKNSPAPYFNLDEEHNLQQCIKSLIQNNYINAAHDVSDGGLFTALTEMAMPNDLGFDIVTDSEIRKDAFLFGESQSRVVVTVVEEDETTFLDMIAEFGVPGLLLGHVTKGRVTVDEQNFGMITDYKEIFDTAIERELVRAN